MSEMVGVNITIGGPLSEEGVPKLCSAIKKEYLTAEIGSVILEGFAPENANDLIGVLNENGHIYLTGEANYGLLEELTTACQELGLTYVHWSAQTVGSDCAVTWRAPGMPEETSCITTQEQERVVLEEQVNDLRKLLLLVTETAGTKEQRDRALFKALISIDTMLPTMPEVPRLVIGEETVQLGKAVALLQEAAATVSPTDVQARTAILDLVDALVPEKEEK